MSNKPTYDARLEQWKIHNNRIYANIFDDNKGRFRDGEDVVTSPIAVGIPSEGVMVETANSRYLLGRKAKEV